MPAWMRTWWKALWKFPLLPLVLAVLCIPLLEISPMALRWPLRIVMAGLFVSGIIRLPHDLDALRKWLEGKLLPSWRRASGWLESRRRPFLAVECAMILPLVALGGIHFLQVASSLSTVSLRTDEIGAVGSYSSEGPVAAVSKYNLAKNHVFFSLVNALTPGADSYHPLRVRFWSMVAVALGMSALLFHFWRRGMFLSGALGFFLIGINFELLDQILEARGYAFIGLASVAGLLGARGYVDTGRRGYLVLLAVSTVLGVWTLPYYVLFGGVLMLLLFLHLPGRETLYAGILCVASILALYSLVLTDIMGVAIGYTDDYGVGFAGIDDLRRTMRYLIPRGLDRFPATTMLAIPAILLATSLIGPRRHRGTRFALAAGAALTMFFFWFCFWMESPPVRIASFLGMTAALLAGMWLQVVLEHKPALLLRPVAALALCIPLAQFGWREIRAYEYQPDQRWRDAARIIRSLYPGGVRIHVNGYEQMLEAYMDDGWEVEVEPPARGKFSRGESVVFDPSHHRSHTPVDPESLPAPALGIHLPLRHDRRQSIYIHIPEDRRIRIPERPPLRLEALSHPRVAVLFNQPVEDNQLETLVNGSHAKPLRLGNLAIIAAANDGEPVRALDIRQREGEADGTLRILAAWRLPPPSP